MLVFVFVFVWCLCLCRCFSTRCSCSSSRLFGVLGVCVLVLLCVIVSFL